MTSCSPFPAIEDLPALDLVLLAGSGGTSNALARARAVEAGRDEGFAVGYAEGRVAALADAGDIVVRAAAALDAATADLAQRDAVEMVELGRGVVDLALQIAAAVIGRELDTAIDPGADAIVRALELAPDRGTMVARLHPEDAATLVDTEALAPGRDLAVVADPSVERGGCVLEVGPARIDAQLSVALGRVADELSRLDAQEFEQMTAERGGRE